MEKNIKKYVLYLNTSKNDTIKLREFAACENADSLIAGFMMGYASCLIGNATQSFYSFTIMRGYDDMTYDLRNAYASALSASVEGE